MKPMPTVYSYSVQLLRVKVLLAIQGKRSPHSDARMVDAMVTLTGVW